MTQQSEMTDRELLELAANAKRYLWIRDNARNVWDGGEALDLIAEGGSALDRAIDKQIAAEIGKGMK